MAGFALKKGIVAVGKNHDIPRHSKERNFIYVSSRSSAGALIGGHCKLKLTMKVNQVKCWFLRRGETGVPGVNFSVQSREPTNLTHI